MILGLTPLGLLVFAAMVFVVGLIVKDTLMIAAKIFGAFILITFIIAFCKAGAVDGSKERGR